MEEEKKMLVCPRCKKELCEIKNFKYPTTIACRTCWKIVKYEPDTEEITRYGIPQRTHSSGMRIY